MSYKHYDWANSRSPPILQPHSLIKHKIIEEYIKDYISGLKIGRKKEIKITIIDGFSGGGIYQTPDTKNTCFGSPFIFLKTIHEMEKWLESKYINNIRIDVVYYFIDKDENALLALKNTLKKQGYGKLLGMRIFLLHGLFSQILFGLGEIIKHRNGKVLFLLDQYGYKDVPLHTIKQIFTKFSHAEIILTFSVGALVNYIADTSQFYKCVGGVNPKYAFLSKQDIHSLLEQKSKIKSLKDKIVWRKNAESKILKRITKILRGVYCSPFSIVSQKSNRHYWLLHLSSEIRSRNKIIKLYQAMQD